MVFQKRSMFTLHPSQCVLLLVDLQDKLFPLISQNERLLESVKKIIRGFRILDIPIVVSEQYPKGLGNTLMQITSLLGESYHPWIKTTFSCMDDPKFCNDHLTLPRKQWLVMGIEAHICVLQTVQGLCKAGKEVAVIQDGIGSRSEENFKIAIEEMKMMGARITSSETVLFELLKDSKHPEFKSIAHLIKGKN